MAQDLDEFFDNNKSWALNEEAIRKEKNKKYKIIAGHRYCTIKTGTRTAYLFDYTDPLMIENVKEKLKYE